MYNKFDIPKLNEEDWVSIQSALDSIKLITNELLNIEEDFIKRKNLNLISVYLGMINIYLGKNYTLDETFKKLKKDIGG